MYLIVEKFQNNGSLQVGTSTDDRKRFYSCK